MNSGSWPRARWLAAIGCGGLWACSFPRPGVAGLAWIAPGLLLALTANEAPRQAMRLGFVAGLSHYLVSLYWLLYNPFVVGAGAGWLALSAYLALYPAAWVWLCHRLRPGFTSTRFAAGSAATPPGESGLGPGWRALAEASWVARAGWAVVCAIVWVALEMVVGRLWSGFPWNLLGVSQYRLTPLIQLSSITGVYGVSFLVVWFSVALMLGGLRLMRDPTRRAVCVSEVMLPLLTVAVVMAWGFQRLQGAPAAPRTIRVALVQPSIPQVLIWDHREDANRFSRVMELSRRALEAEPDLLVWPEAAMPAFTDENYRAITNLIAAHHVWMVFGADDFERRPGATDPEEGDVFNAAFLFDSAGRYVAGYHKQHLVIFGEYVPLARWLPFLKHFTPLGESFAEGFGPVPFRIAAPRCTASVLICFEDVFPHLARRNVTPDTDFLLNLTNNGWFDESAAQWQHAANAVFRAVENGLPLVRCTNNGLTCWIDAFGRIREIFAGEGGSVYGAGFLDCTLPLPAEGNHPARTFYHRHGDWFGWGCVGLALAALALNFRASRRRSEVRSS